MSSSSSTPAAMAAAVVAVRGARALANPEGRGKDRSGLRIVDIFDVCVENKTK